ncbi:MAG: hypothetical protein IT461_16095 [Planctomycetes bacterium]|nr:hypothetical protein [Planctomycetota bacterium]
MNTPAPVKTMAAKTPVKPDERPAVTPPAKPKQKAKPVGLSTLKGTPEARRQAALILEVLGGLRGPSDAAKAMGVALPRYYMLETRALQALIKAMEPLPRGPRRNPDAEIAALQKQLTRQKQELVRGQSLQRAMRSAMGIPVAPPKDAKPEPGKRKPKRPSVRALKAVKVLRAGLEDPQAAAAHAPKPLTGQEVKA